MTAPADDTGGARWCVTVTVCCPDQGDLVRAAEAGQRMATGLAMEGLPVHLTVGPYCGGEDDPPDGQP